MKTGLNQAERFSPGRFPRNGRNGVEALAALRKAAQSEIVSFGGADNRVNQRKKKEIH